MSVEEILLRHGSTEIDRRRNYTRHEGMSAKEDLMVVLIQENILSTFEV